MSKDKKKKKKQKITYIDDGRTLADMSNVGRRKPSYGAKGSLKDQGKTFFNAMRMMFIPMLAVMGIITLAFFIMWLSLTIAS